MSTYYMSRLLSTPAVVSVSLHNSASEDEHSRFQMGKLRLREIKQLDQGLLTDTEQPGGRASLQVRGPRAVRVLLTVGCVSGPHSGSAWPSHLCLGGLAAGPALCLAGRLKLCSSIVCFSDSFSPTQGSRFVLAPLVAPPWGFQALRFRASPVSEQTPSGTFRPPLWASTNYR